MATNEIIISAIASAGGIGGLILFFSKFIFNKLNERYLLTLDKKLASYNSDLNKKLADYQASLRLNNEIMLRYTNHQFTAYNELWATLYDLKVRADALWVVNPRSTDFFLFAEQLKKTKDQIGKSALLIESGVYIKLRDIIERFANYKTHKGKLIGLKENARYVSREEIKRITDINRDDRKKYNILLEKTEKLLRSQLTGEAVTNGKQLKINF